ncbi:hypothetical protein QTJ16_002049 [Diplocarpon rosae]|uniref:Uncharacterized protein n=1 Tax=Diplocarpon rosae TaxID=946125 RepID=A0AAD9T4A0_9HELO|nr:hypothetical protein QTJ16_002049 [Diplocarpon rosae]PBP23067.1 hypothetical protein BUE80_DR005746 [Diplocarpon rosae]
MPFNFNTFQAKCEDLTPEELQREWNNYTRQFSSGATSAATAVAFAPLTAGVSLLGLGFSAPRVYNARRKREIVEGELQTHGKTHTTRKRDVIAPAAISGAIGGLTLGFSAPAAQLVAGHAAGKGAEYIGTHVVLDAVGAAIEHQHDKHATKKAHKQAKLRSQQCQQCQQCQQELLQEEASQDILIPERPQMPGSPVEPQPAAQIPQIADGSVGSQGYHPPPPLQDEKYEYVPVPIPVPVSAPRDESVSYQPASHPNTLKPGEKRPPVSAEQQLPPYSPAHRAGPPGPVQASPPQARPSIRRKPTSPMAKIQIPQASATPRSNPPRPWSQQDPEAQSEPVSPVLDHNSATADAPTVPFAVPTSQIPKSYILQPYPTPRLTPPPPWSQQDPEAESEPVSPVLEHIPPTAEAPVAPCAIDYYNSAAKKYPLLGVSAIPGGLVTGAAPADHTLSAVERMEKEIMILRARIEMEKSKGLIEALPSYPTLPGEQVSAQSLQQQDVKYPILA